jgi:DNA phosphorothioation-dependent restriction protein DptG
MAVRVIEGMLQVSADKIGVSVDDLKAALQSGQSVADVANAHSVNPSDVVTAIVDAGTTKIDEAVASGTLTQTQADLVKSHLPDAADRFVNHTKSC